MSYGTRSPQQIASRMVVLPVDTVLKVRLDRTLGSDRSRRGDRFTAIVENTALPDGTRVWGVVLGATPADRENPGTLGLDFRTLEFPGGQQVAIAGTATSLDRKSVWTDEDGRLVATSNSKKYTGKYMVYGAGVGLLLGSMLGKRGFGGIVGTVAGFLLGQQKDKNRNIVLREGLAFGVRLDREAQIRQEVARAEEPDDDGKLATAEPGGSPSIPPLPDLGPSAPGATGGETPGAAPPGDRSTATTPSRPAGPPLPGAGPATANAKSSRVRVSGGARVRLLTDPGRIPIGRPTEIEFRIEDLSESDEAVPDPTVKAWLAKLGERARRPIPVHSTGEYGAYGLEYTFETAGDYRFTVAVLTEMGDAFKMDFILPVSVPNAESEGRATGSTPEAPPVARPADPGPATPQPGAGPGVDRSTPAPPVDSGSATPAPRGRARGAARAADRARVAVTSEGFIEAEWRATDPPVTAVTFALLDAAGKTMETRRVTSAPFATRFPRPADAYFADGATHVQVSAELAGGLQAEVLVPVRKSLPRPDEGIVKPARLAALTDWNTFYREFCAAVARRDRTALKSCMVRDFLFTLDEYDGADARDAAFQQWDRPDVKGWAAIDRILRKGCRLDPQAPALMVSPPQWVTDPKYLGYRVGFARCDGLWRWVWAMHGV
jgi:hypothetical protein